MSYDKIDSFIKNWTSRNNLSLQTTYKDSDVRSISVVDKMGRQYQIWIDRPGYNGEVYIHAWDYKQKKKDLLSSIDTLDSDLDTAYKTVLDWIKNS